MLQNMISAANTTLPWGLFDASEMDVFRSILSSENSAITSVKPIFPPASISKNKSDTNDDISSDSSVENFRDLSSSYSIPTSDFLDEKGILDFCDNITDVDQFSPNSGISSSLRSTYEGSSPFTPRQDYPAESSQVLEEEKNNAENKLNQLINSATDAVGKFLREKGLSARDAITLEIHELLLQAPKKQRHSYGKRESRMGKSHEISRERNREHAKATRIRRRIFIEAERRIHMGVHKLKNRPKESGGKPSSSS